MKEIDRYFQKALKQGERKPLKLEQIPFGFLPVTREGSIKMDTFTRMINHPRLQKLPFILETPNELPGYEQEMKQMREAYIEIS